ncbi:MAG TPA: phosphotransferase [Gemmatimonadaceae bacterium]
MTFTVAIGTDLSDSVLGTELKYLGGPSHVGRAESERLMGAGRDYGRGPLPTFLAAFDQARRAGAPAGLLLLSDTGTIPVAAALAPLVCGAEHVVAAPGAVPWEPMIEAIHRLTGTDPLATDGRDEVQFLLFGCQTEERVLAASLFLRSILGYTRVATSPHLVGSATTEAHLAMLRRHLPRAGVHVLLRLEDAARWAGVDETVMQSLRCTACEIEPADFREGLGETARHIVELLCLHWTRAQLHPLAGGFSGSLLLLASGWKGHARTEPMVLKVDTCQQMRREIDGYHMVKDLLGKHVPTFDLPVTMNGSLGVGMELAAMEGAPASLQDAFEEAESDEQAERFLRRLDKTLELLSSRLYRNTRRIDWVSPYRAFHLHIDLQLQWLDENLDAIARHWKADTGGELPLDRAMLATLLRTINRNEDGVETEVCLVHGDLNLKNVICDHGENVWLIDWTHCGRMPVELDFAKMENDVKFVMSKEFGLEDLPRLRQVEEYLVRQRIPSTVDSLPDDLRFAKWDLRFRKMLLVVRRIRQVCFDLKEGEQWLVYRAALLKYALHSLSFDRRRGRGECDLPQLMHALYSVESLLNDLMVDDFQLRIRGERPSCYPPRQRVSIDSAPWAVECPEYHPPYYVAPEVLANDCTCVAGGWADPEDITLVSEDLATLGVKRDAAGRPLHPHGRTGLSGRGSLGRWGPNVVVVAVITRAVSGASGLEILLGTPEASEALVLPRDFVRSREAAEAALARVIEATAGWRMNLPSEVLSEGYEYDLRRTDHAWVVTSVRHVHVTDGGVEDFFRAGAGFESISWHPLDAATINRVPAPSARHARAAVRALGAAGQLTGATVSAVLAATG